MSIKYPIHFMPIYVGKRASRPTLNSFRYEEEEALNTIKIREYMCVSGTDALASASVWGEDIDNLLQKEIETNHIRLK